MEATRASVALRGAPAHVQATTYPSSRAPRCASKTTHLGRASVRHRGSRGRLALAASATVGRGTETVNLDAIRKAIGAIAVGKNGSKPMPEEVVPAVTAALDALEVRGRETVCVYERESKMKSFRALRPLTSSPCPSSAGPRSMEDISCAGGARGGGGRGRHGCAAQSGSVGLAVHEARAAPVRDAHARTLRWPGPRSAGTVLQRRALLVYRHVTTLPSPPLCPSLLLLLSPEVHTRTSLSAA
jgi:hypothetical protein